MSVPKPQPEPFDSSYTFPVVGVVKSCYSAKFGVPRQARLVDEATGYIELLPPYNQPNCVRELEGFSHIWVFFVFHHNLREGWKATVRPPRLGGDKRIGVFATRSPFRPSPIGLSAVKLTSVECKDHGIIRIHVAGLDIVNNTPVIDIKPYIPFTDSIPTASGSFASIEPDAEAIHVEVTPEAEKQFAVMEERGLENFRSLAVKVISADPRPAYQKEEGRVYGVFIQNHEVVWEMHGDNATITEVRW